MAKKKKSDELQVTSDEQLPVSSEPQVWASATPYTVGKWRGFTQYKCVLCAFDTLNEDAIFKHIETHKLGKPQTKPAVLVADKRGNDVTNQISRDGDLGDVFEVELKEVGSTTDEQGNEHKTFTIKE